MIFVDKTGVNLLIRICVVKINSEQQARGNLVTWYKLAIVVSSKCDSISL